MTMERFAGTVEGDGEDELPAYAMDYVWMPGVWGQWQHICANLGYSHYDWVPLAACRRAVIVDCPPDVPELDWTSWWHCCDCLTWAAQRADRNAGKG